MIDLLVVALLTALITMTLLYVDARAELKHQRVEIDRLRTSNRILIAHQRGRPKRTPIIALRAIR